MTREGNSWSCLPHEHPSAVLSLSNSKEAVFDTRGFYFDYINRDLGMIAQPLYHQSIGVTQLTPHNDSLLPLDYIWDHLQCLLSVGGVAPQP